MNDEKAFLRALKPLSLKKETLQLFLEQAAGANFLRAVKTLAGQGELTDAKTLIGLMWLQNWRAGHWALAWQDAPDFAKP